MSRGAIRMSNTVTCIHVKLTLLLEFYLCNDDARQLGPRWPAHLRLPPAMPRAPKTRCRTGDSPGKKNPPGHAQERPGSRLILQRPIRVKGHFEPSETDGVPLARR